MSTVEETTGTLADQQELPVEVRNFFNDPNNAKAIFKGFEWLEKKVKEVDIRVKRLEESATDANSPIVHQNGRKARPTHLPPDMGGSHAYLPRILLTATAEDIIAGDPDYHMRTTVSLHIDNRLRGRTRIWTDAVLSGFTGGVFVALVGEDDIVLGSTELKTKGVTGQLFAPVDNFWGGGENMSDRQIYIEEEFPPSVVQRTKYLYILHCHAPNSHIDKIIFKVGVALEVALRAVQILLTGGAPDEEGKDAGVS